MPQEDFIIMTYCLVDEYYRKYFGTQVIRQRGFNPKLTDAEALTLEIVGEFFGCDTDVGIWRYFKQHWIDWFPALGSRSNFSKQVANLWYVKQKIQEHLAVAMQATHDNLHMADGFPVPTCKFKRAYFSRLFKDFANYGYCASKDETYYGFKGNICICSEGIITGNTLTAANVDERQSLFEIVGNIEDLLIADKGLIGADYQQQFQMETAVNLQTPTRQNQEDPRGKDANSWLTSTRRLVETVIGQLTEQFHIQKVRARDLWHLTARMARKILAHTVAIWINKQLGNPPLQFERLMPS